MSTVFALGVLCGSGRVARAFPDEDADSIIERGIELREQGRDEEALSLFTRALGLAPTPRARAHVALAEQAVGMWLAAEADLTLALAATTDSWILKNRAALEGALAVVVRHLGKLEVHGTDGAEVLLDGVSLGTLPVKTPFRVEAGPRTLELRKSGYHATARAIEIPPGGIARATITLVPFPPSPRAAMITEEGVEEAPGASREPSSMDDPSRGQVQKILGWSFVSTGAAALALGGVGLVVRASIVEAYNDQCPGLGVAQPAGCDDKVSAAGTWATVSAVAFVAGGVLALGGVTLVATAPRRSSRRSRASTTFRCAPSVPALGVSCIGAF